MDVNTEEAQRLEKQRAWSYISYDNNVLLQNYGTVIKWADIYICIFNSIQNQLCTKQESATTYDYIGKIMPDLEKPTSMRGAHHKSNTQVQLCLVTQYVWNQIGSLCADTTTRLWSNQQSSFQKNKVTIPKFQNNFHQQHAKAQYLLKLLKVVH